MIWGDILTHRSERGGGVPFLDLFFLFSISKRLYKLGGGGFLKSGNQESTIDKGQLHKKWYTRIKTKPIRSNSDLPHQWY